MSSENVLINSFDAKRALWEVGSICLIFSRSKNKWLAGEIIEIEVKEEANDINNEKEEPIYDEWMIVKYGIKQTKRIQRNCKDIIPIPKDHPSLIEKGSYCKIYSDVSLTWCYGTVTEIFNDDEGEWLKVKFNEFGAPKICDVQRYAKDIMLIPQEEDEKSVSVSYIESHQKELEIFPEIKHILIDEHAIKKRLKELGGEITEHYKNTNEELVCIGILNGAFMFFTDLIRNIKIAHRVEFMKLKSYKGTKQANGINILLDLQCSVENKHILIIEDLIDTGNTMMWLVNYLGSKKAKSVKIACLLQKQTKRLNKDFKIKIDWIGFPQVVDEWLVGFGTDYKHRYRHLSYLASLKESVYTCK